MTEPQRHDPLEYWRGSIDTRLQAVDIAAQQIREQIRESKNETTAGLKLFSESVAAQLQAMQAEMQHTSRILYRIIGVGIALAALAPLIWPRLLPLAK